MDIMKRKHIHAKRCFYSLVAVARRVQERVAQLQCDGGHHDCAPATQSSWMKLQENIPYQMVIQWSRETTQFALSSRHLPRPRMADGWANAFHVDLHPPGINKHLYEIASWGLLMRESRIRSLERILRPKKNTFSFDSQYLS